MTKRLFFALQLIASTIYATLAEEATNPVTRIQQFQFEDDYSSSNYGAKGTQNNIYFKPIYLLPKNRHIPFRQQIRCKFVAGTLPKSKTTVAAFSTEDTQFYDLFILIDHEKFRFGMGPMGILPTASKLQAGQGKWQLGPAVGFSYYPIPRLQLAFLAQNPIAFAGVSKLPHQNTLYFQPFIVYHFMKDGYVLSNAEWTIVWNRHQIQIPVNIGFGTIVNIGKQKINFEVAAKWMVYQRATGVNGKFTTQFSCNFLFE